MSILPKGGKIFSKLGLYCVGGTISASERWRDGTHSSTKAADVARTQRNEV